MCASLTHLITTYLIHMPHFKSSYKREKIIYDYHIKV